MGLFAGSAPPPMPTFSRTDFAEVASYLPAEAATEGPELEFLDRNISANDSVVALATLWISGRTSRGAIVLTDKRLVTALGGRDKRRRPLGGQPSVDTLKIKDIDRISAEKYIKKYMNTTILMKNGDRYRDLLIGPDIEHGSWFVGLISDMVTKAKLA